MLMTGICGRLRPPSRPCIFASDDLVSFSHQANGIFDGPVYASGWMNSRAYRSRFTPLRTVPRYLPCWASFQFRAWSKSHTHSAPCSWLNVFEVVDGQLAKQHRKHPPQEFTNVPLDSTNDYDVALRPRSEPTSIHNGLSRLNGPGLSVLLAFFLLYSASGLPRRASIT
ncbi:hypothetical protein VTK56DRAFT_7141 [Thermocarpiscus australiensis]